MSDSELSDAPSTSVPSDAILEKELHKQVTIWMKTPGNDMPTVNNIRGSTEKALGLDVGFFIGHATWKTKSKIIIKDAVENTDAPFLSPQPVSAKPSPIKPPPAKAASKPRPRKRASPPDEGPKKRQKKSLPLMESEDASEMSSPPTDLSADEDTPKPKKKPTKQQQVATTSNSRMTDAKPKAISKSKAKVKKFDSDTDLSDAPAEESEEKSKPTMKSNPDNDSGSELSVLLDEDPKSKKRRKSKDLSDKAKKATKPPADGDLDQEEIKRLQGWLVKCGIRKLWGKELKPYETSRAKIKHLKDMLSEAGLTGRYSQEKATQIREARELAADIEAVQEGAERWGKDADEEEEEDDGRSKRKLVRGKKHYDFLSSDGEETD